MVVLAVWVLCCWVVGVGFGFSGCFAVLLVILLRLCCFGARFADLPGFASFLWVITVWVLGVLLDFGRGLCLFAVCG